MKSGLEDRNNARWITAAQGITLMVSMKSGLEDRNNTVRPGKEGPFFERSQ